MMSLQVRCLLSGREAVGRAQVAGGAGELEGRPALRNPQAAALVARRQASNVGIKKLMAE